MDSDFSIYPLQRFVDEQHFFFFRFRLTKSRKSPFQLPTQETPERKKIFSCYPRDTKWATTTARFALLLSE